MTTAKINYKGIARAGSNQQVQDGYLDEAINVRHRDGKLTTRGKVTKLYSLPATSFDKIFLHDQDEISNYIGYKKSTGQIHKITFGVSSSTSTLIYTLAAGKEADIAFIKRFMIITTESETLTFLFFEGNYMKIDMPAVPYISSAMAEDMEWKMTESASTANSLLGYYFKEVNQLSEKYGKLTGGIMYRTALRMFDGSYVLHTLPRFLNLGMEVKVHANVGQFRLSFSASNIKIGILKSEFEGVNTDIFTDFVVFACKNESIYEISESTIDDDLTEMLDETSESGIDYGLALSGSMSVMNEDFRNMPDAKAWYKIYEKKITEIQELIGPSLFEIANTKGFYQDYATRETLPVDQFSHHKFSGQVAYTYNDRLLLGDIFTRFGQYAAYLNFLHIDDTNWIQEWEGLIQNTVPDSGLSDYAALTLENVSQTTGTIAFEFTLSVHGKKIIITKQTDDQTFYYDSEKYYFVLPEILGYPDTRATQMRLLYHDSGNTRWIEISKYNLRASKNDNYAYYCENITINVEPTPYSTYTTNPQTARRYIVAELTLSDTGNKVTTLSVQEDLIDSNRVQASELQNPLFFPAKNSYQVGTGNILGIAANTEPLSQGQFGEYPLSVFTSKGIWTMLQGSGEVLFSNILPLNGEVPVNVDQITPLSVGVVYSTGRGLYLISGREVKNLSEVLVGPVNVEFQANSHYQFYINHASLVQLSSKLSTVDAKTYISGAKIGYDKQNNELLVTNYSYPYSYVYSFESGFWYKTSDSFRLLINAYPTLLGVDSTGIHSISDETTTGSVQVLITTRPCKLEMESTYKLIRQAIQRCELKTPENIFAGFYVFASNDLQKWQLFSISNNKSSTITDIQVLRGYTKARYYIFVFAAELEAGSAINNVDILFDPVLSNKLR